MFSRSNVFGDNYVNGIEPASVLEATRRTIFEKLVSGKSLESILKPYHRVVAALQVAKTPFENVS